MTIFDRTSRVGLLVILMLAAFQPIPILGRESAAPAQVLNVWVESISNKVQPTTAPGATSSLNLEGAQRSVEAAQIIVHANGSALTGVNLTAGDLSDGHGHTLARSNLHFFREYFINFTGVVEGEPGNRPVPANSPTSDPNLADPLIPFVDPYTTTIRSVGAPFNVAANRNQPVWVDVNIPEATTAGTYTGVITVSAAGEANVIVPVTLTVWNFVLPDMRSVTTHFKTFRRHLDLVSPQHVRLLGQQLLARLDALRAHARQTLRRTGARSSHRYGTILHPRSWQRLQSAQ